MTQINRDLLAPAKESGKYTCPICGGNNLSINKRSGAYSCFNGCDTKDLYKAFIEMGVIKSEPSPQWQKPPRPAKTRYWEYPDANGNPLVRVKRVDDGKGHKKISQQHWNGREWSSGYGAITRDQIPPYRCQEIRNSIKNAIAMGEKPVIVIAEGEPVVDVLWGLGIPATCNIGGSGKWQASDSQYLKDCEIVISPDRDKPGIKNLDHLLNFFPDAKFIYPFPDSPLWHYLPDKEGADLADLIEENGIKDKAKILSLITDKRIDNGGDNVVVLADHRDRKNSQSLSELDQEINTLIEGNLSEYEREKEIIRICSDPRFTGLIKSPYQIRELVRNREKDIERQESLADDFKQFEKVLKIPTPSLDYLLPYPLAKALESKADSARLDPMRLLFNLLPAISTVVGSRARVIAKKEIEFSDNWLEYPIFWVADVSPPSSGKSVAQSAIWKPLEQQQQQELRRAKNAENELKDLEDKLSGIKPKDRDKNDVERVKFLKQESKLKHFIFSTTTPEGMFKLLAEQNEYQGAVWLLDELSRFVNLDQYKNNGGDSRQQLLSMWNGKITSSVVRSEKNKSYFFQGQTLSLCGGIQPGIAKKLFNSQSDPDGFLSRLLVLIPEHHSQFDKWSEGSVSTHSLLKEFYGNLSKITSKYCSKDDEEKRQELTAYFNSEAYFLWINQWESLRKGIRHYEATNPAYSGFLGKQCSYIPRFSLIFHLMDCCYDSSLNPTQITPSAVERAIAFSKFCCKQFRLLQGQSDDQPSLDGLLLKVWKFCQEKGEVTAREAARKFNGTKVNGEKMNSSLALSIFTQLASKGYGVLEGNKLKCHDPSLLCHGHNDTLKPLSIKDSSQSVIVSLPTPPHPTDLNPNRTNGLSTPINPDLYMGNNDSNDKSLDPVGGKDSSCHDDHDTLMTDHDTPTPLPKKPDKRDERGTLIYEIENVAVYIANGLDPRWNCDRTLDQVYGLFKVSVLDALSLSQLRGLYDHLASVAMKRKDPFPSREQQAGYSQSELSLNS